ncbi:MAG: SRPBCC family protein [Rhodospirillales bacterium]|nr:SRPBCC family protein [Rhodospirillales bacterium]
MKIEERFTVAAPPDRVWAVITDPVKMMPCIPGCEAIEVVSPTQYKAKVVVKVGPITARFSFDVEITEQVHPSHILSVTRGEEGSRASLVTTNNELRLTPQADGRTEIYYSSEISVTGRLAKFGLSIMKKKAKAMGEDFANTFRDLVEKGELSHDGTQLSPAANA